MDTIGSRLRALRERTGLSQKEFAEKIGLKQSTYNGYETGKHIPKSDILISLADHYGVPVGYLLGQDAPSDCEAAPLANSPYDQRLAGLLQSATPEMKRALIVLLEQALASE